MKNKLLSMLVILSVISVNFPGVYADTENTVYIYVSPDGKTDGDGSVANPFASITDADKYIKTLKTMLSEEKEFQVILRGGEYRMESGITMNSENTGFSDENRVIYRAMEGETPVIKGSKLLDISGFSAVTDENVLKRLPEKAKEHILVLDLKEQGITELSADFSSKMKSIPYVNIYHNDIEQSVAQWPNGEYNYSTYTQDTSDAEVIYTEDPGKVMRWAEETDAVFSGYFNDYEYTDNLFDMKGVTESGGIRLDKTSATPKSNTKRFKMFNLLSELDVPGEWYIDKAEMMLYYYPQHEFKAGDKLEISLLSETMFKINNGASNLTFDGITFSQTCGSIIGGQVNKNAVNENITVNNCTFTDIGGKAVNLYSYTYCPFYDYADWQNRVAKVKNIAVTNNIFYNMHDSSVVIHSGNPEKLEEYGVTVKNNYANQSYSYNGTVPVLLGSFNSIGAVIENNIVHNVAKNALGVMGSRNKINKNDIAHTTRQVADAGAFYSGRTIMQRENEYGYNFFHKMKPVSDVLIPYTANRAIYFDDSYSGGYMHHNIVVDGDIAISTSGNGSTIEDNISVDCSNGISLGVWVGVDRYSTLLSEENLAKENVQWYLSQFPEIEEEYEIIKASDFTVTTGNEVTGNFTVYGKNPNEGLSDAMLLSNSFSGNTRKNDYGDFVNPEVLDYRVRKDSDVYINNPKLLSEDFDLSQIGIQWDEGFDKERITSRRRFDIVAPVGGEFSKEESIELMWEKAFDADLYRVEFAKNEDFSNIIKSVEVPYNYCTMDLNSLNAENVYWRVYAINETLSMNGEWCSDSSGYIKINDFVSDEELTIESSILNGGFLEVKFSNQPDEESLEGNIHIYDKDNIEIENIEYSLKENILNITLPKECYNSVFSVVLDEKISYGNSLLGEKYVASLEQKGFFEDFGTDYSVGDWQYKVRTDNGNASYDIKNPAYVSDDGVLYVSNNESPVTTERTMVFKSDYEDYSLKDSVLEFDYMRTAVADADNFEVFLRANRSGDARYEPIYGTGWKLFLNNAYSMTFRYGNLHMKKAVNTESYIANTTDALAPNTIDVWYRYRIEMQNEEAFTKIRVYSAEYTDEVLGEYELLKEYSYERDETLTEGTAVFSVSGGSGAALDNIIFAERKPVCFKSFAEMNQQIRLEVQGMKNSSADYSMKSEELCRISALINNKAIAECYEILNGIELVVTESYFDSNKLVFKFNMPINDVSSDNITLKMSDENTSCTFEVKDNFLYLEIPKECFNNDCTAQISGVVSKYANAMKKSYSVNFKLNGFFDDFSKDTSVWKYRTYNSTKDAFLKDGMLLLSDKADSAASSVILLQREDYLDYMYENTVLEYDYICLSEQSNSWQEQVGPVLGLNDDSVYIENWNWRFNDGYSFINWYNYEKMYFMKNSKSKITESSEILQYSQQLDVGKKYRYRILKQTEGETIYFNIYRAEYDGDTLGEYKFITKTSAPVTENNSGSFLFFAYIGTNVCVDNVLYADIDSPMVSASDKITLTNYGENVILGNVYGREQEATVVFTYFNNGKLAEVKTEAVTFNYDEIKKEVKIPEQSEEEYDTINVFVWDSLNGMLPMSEVLNF